MITDDLQDKLERLIESRGLRLYGLEFVRTGHERTFRIYIHSKDGINLTHCEEISDLVSPLLDVELEAVDSYNLEVSSPGIERVLKEERHFRCSLGEMVEAKLLDSRGVVRGRLKDYARDDDGDYVELDGVDSAEAVDGCLRLRVRECKRIRTFFVWND